jgi:hypothetical protein
MDTLLLLGVSGLVLVALRASARRRRKSSAPSVGGVTTLPLHEAHVVRKTSPKKLAALDSASSMLH